MINEISASKLPDVRPFKSFLLSLEGLGQAAIMTAETFALIFKGEISAKNVFPCMVEVGWKSTFIIFLTSFFTGMVLALQVGAVTLNLFNEPIYVGTVTGFSVFMELGPVLTAIVVAGRVGAAIAAELGSMKVTEQIDALCTLGTSPVKFLAVPRFLACFFMLPVLTVIADIIGIAGGMFLTTTRWGVSPNVYWQEAFELMTTRTFLHGFIKSFFFALIIAAIACHKGFNAKGGAQGVGKATTSSVIFSTVFILISDYFLSSLLSALKIE